MIYMTGLKNVLGKVEYVLIETEDFIFPIRIEHVLYAEINNQHCIQIYGLETNYHVTDRQNNLIILLEKAGFIAIQQNLYVNPKHISEYQITEQLVELISGKRLAIQPEFSHQLISYFSVL